MTERNTHSAHVACWQNHVMQTAYQGALEKRPGNIWLWLVKEEPLLLVVIASAFLVLVQAACVFGG